ncbi:hypothetical protein CLV84_2245 [Neolewinella xylanilytica]|uniref:Uncharacterized protein n=1 Tax=Neolewinella xylanilytica TaxID=1514080 RepID=A0A2S6I2Q3_9BACT|nr:hypothetical protein [Neolewinella xylanilytica]PPK85349.1 hypothetical protein CLV84_2245 [Neolewinella xylanilytica]
MIRILPLFLALTMLVGSVGVTVSRHFCMGELKSLTLYGEAEACEMDAVVSQPACPMHAKSAKKGCCDDEHEFVSWDDDRQLSEAVPLPPTAWIASPAPIVPPWALHLPDSYRGAALRPFQHYRPPPLVIDVPRAWQVFRL